MKQRGGDECLRACAASILDIPYEETPTISAAVAPNREFWKAWTDWAAERDAAMLFYYGEQPVDRHRWVAVVPSLSLPGKDHAVVMESTRLLLDPSRISTYTTVSPRDVKYGITFG